ncbi:CDP-alcohol phosphatidyltransferase family protein, partial [Klebsiella michiganensis]|uniref:CDP-alcohol phosphatidyltransferase family protein n=1 Tax=Klebsiella michiganensis TaxID=1134687 RepID=UPI0034D01CFC
MTKVFMRTSVVRWRTGRVGGVTQAKPSNFNLPNVLTSLRILLIPVFSYLVIRQRMWWAFW